LRSSQTTLIGATGRANFQIRREDVEAVEHTTEEKWGMLRVAFYKQADPLSAPPVASHTGTSNVPLKVPPANVR
jgi:hypothetical protein